MTNENRHHLKEFDNPFKSDNVEEIRICIMAPMAFGNPTKKIAYSGKICFAQVNGSDGTHRLEADSMEELMEKIKAFTDSL